MSVTSLTRKLSFWQTPAAPSASLATAGCRARSQGAQCLPPACAGYSRPVPGFSRPLHASPKSAFESSPFHPPSSALDCFTLIPLISELDFPSAFIPVALRTGGAPKTPFPLSNPALSTVFTRSFLPSCAPNPPPFPLGVGERARVPWQQRIVCDWVLPFALDSWRTMADKTW